MDRLPDELKEPLVELLLSVADDKLMLGHRNADWTGLAPILEEDIAFSALAQDELAHATALYQMAAPLVGKTPDQLAFGRRPEDYRCAAIVEVSDDFDWATALCRNFICDHFDALRLQRLALSTYVPLAQLGARLAAEEQIHVEHVDGWLQRLGRGGAEARSRMQVGLDRVAPLAGSLCEPTAGLDALEGAGVYPQLNPDHFFQWKNVLEKVAGNAGLNLSVSTVASAPAGRQGRHGATFAATLDELTEVYRLEPEAAW